MRKDALPAEQKKGFSLQIVGFLKTRFPDNPWVNPASWPRCREFISHSVAATKKADYLDENEDIALLLNRMGIYLHSVGIYIQAELLFRRALAIREKQLGPDHPDVAQSLNNLAGLLQAQGKYFVCPGQQ